MRLIDADELKELFAEVISGIAKKPEITKDLEHMVRASAMTIQMIDDAPTIDAVEVVRCKDCKYMTEHYDTDGNVPYWTCSEWDSGTDYDGFCHYAERRTDGTD